METNEKIKKEHLKRTGKLREIKLYGRNLIKRVNTKAVPHVRYSGLFLRLIREENFNKWTREQENS